jgi:exodeoxyribonuclease VII small subunit
LSPEPPSSATFEESFLAVESAVERLERGDLPLEESLRQYEQGVRALVRCREVLGEARKRIEVLARDAGLEKKDGSEVSWEAGEAHPQLRGALAGIDREDELGSAGEDGKDNSGATESDPDGKQADG